MEQKLKNYYQKILSARRRLKELQAKPLRRYPERPATNKMVTTKRQNAIESQIRKLAYMIKNTEFARVPFRAWYRLSLEEATQIIADNPNIFAQAKSALTAEAGQIGGRIGGRISKGGGRPFKNKAERKA